jgi:AraC-like DNA-binding protein
VALAAGALKVLPQDALECSFMKPGRGENYRDGWVHTKTCPFTIVALATVGRYETLLGGVRSVCEAGEAFLVPANHQVSITHRFDPRRGTMASRWLHAHWTLFGTIDFVSLLKLPPRLDRDRTRPLWELIEELLGLDGSAGLTRTAREKELSFRALRLLCEVAPPREGALDFLHRSERLIPAIAYIRENLCERISIRSLARAAYLSTSRLHALFREQMGCSPMSYVKAVRLSEARRKLSATQISIAGVADATGFSNQFHFSREFKRAFGQAPSAYRREHSGLEV